MEVLAVLCNSVCIVLSLTTWWGLAGDTIMDVGCVCAKALSVLNRIIARVAANRNKETIFISIPSNMDLF